MGLWFFLKGVLGNLTPDDYYEDLVKEIEDLTKEISSISSRISDIRRNALSRDSYSSKGQFS